MGTLSHPWILVALFIAANIWQRNFTDLLKVASTKLKPQIMSIIALILGMLSMALQLGESGKEIQAPLGIVFIGGLLVSTILTLFIVPSLLYVFSTVRRK